MSAAAVSALFPGIRLAEAPADPSIRSGDPAIRERPKTLPIRSLGILGPDGGDLAAALPAILPDGGLPRGAVVELASARALGRATALALAACSAAQAEARLRTDDPHTVGAWCAFIDPWSTLHAPAVVRCGVDPSRLLVVRPPLDTAAEGGLSRVAVRVAQSRAFAMIVIDTAGVPGSERVARFGDDRSVPAVRLDRWVNVVRRLALAVERTDTAVVLITDATAHRPLPLPVAMRLELARITKHGEERWMVKVAKERHGRVGATVALAAR